MNHKRQESFLSSANSVTSIVKHHIAVAQGKALLVLSSILLSRPLCGTEQDYSYVCMQADIIHEDSTLVSSPRAQAVLLLIS